MGVSKTNPFRPHPWPLDVTLLEGPLRLQRGDRWRETHRDLIYCQKSKEIQILFLLHAWGTEYIVSSRRGTNGTTLSFSSRRFTRSFLRNSMCVNPYSRFRNHKMETVCRGLEPISDLRFFFFFKREETPLSRPGRVCILEIKITVLWHFITWRLLKDTFT